MPSVNVTCPRVLEDGSPCEAEMEIECEVEPSDWYGADADGNRGMYIPASLIADHVPESCPEGHVFTPEEEKQLQNSADEQASRYEYEPAKPDDAYEY